MEITLEYVHGSVADNAALVFASNTPKLGEKQPYCAFDMFANNNTDKINNSLFIRCNVIIQLLIDSVFQEEPMMGSLSSIR
jgi:hypothetical protein